MTNTHSFYEVTKPGIVYGNALNAATGFFLASQGNIAWAVLGVTLVGLSLVVACAGVVNNYIDRDIDGLMERTKKRPIPTGQISGRIALLFASVLGVAGAMVLGLYINTLALGVTLAGLLIYLCLYTPLKRHTPFATEAGSLAGAMPPVVGYVAVTGAFDMGAFALFLLFVFWQMPHFFAIAINREDEYASAKIPVLPITHGLRRTKIHILVYIVAFSVVALSLVYLGLAGPLSIAVIGGASAFWFLLALRSFWAKDERRSARQLFFFSLIVVLLLCVVLMLHR